MTASQSKHRNIRRRENEKKRMHTWIVHLRRRNELTYRSFSDSVYGGKEEALVAAIAYRDQLLSCHSYFEHQVWRRTRLLKNNTSGISGVGRYESLDARTGRRNAFWMASWTDEQGMRRGRRYYVSCHGDHQAKRLAVAERERQLLRVCAIKARHGQD